MFRCYYCPQPATWLIEALRPEPLAARGETYSDYALTCDRGNCAGHGTRWAETVGTVSTRRPLTLSEAEAVTGETTT